MSTRFSRRTLLEGIAGIASSAAMGAGSRAFAGPGSSPKLDMSQRPRAMVQFVLSGGVDAILTTDPKRRSEVRPIVDLPYGESDILQFGGVSLMKTAKALEPHLPNTAILNGVKVFTVGHIPGHVQIHQMRRTFPSGALGLSEVVGAVRGKDVPVQSVWFRGGGNLMSVFPGPRSLCIDASMSAKLLPALSALRRDEPRRRALLAVTGENLAKCGVASACGPHEVLRDLLLHMPEMPLPEPIDASTPRFFLSRADGGQNGVLLAETFRDILYLLENDLTRSIFVQVGYSLDTHNDNNDLQTDLCGNLLFPGFAYFFNELKRRVGPDKRPLAEKTGVILASELGRFPVLNSFMGKDHFPEIPVLLFGPGLNGGQYGATDSMMASQPISLKTGKPSSSASDVIPTIDDLGVSLLHWMGVEDTAQFGYFGRPLDFLFA